jgi:colicin import membrane protein
MNRSFIRSAVITSSLPLIAALALAPAPASAEDRTPRDIYSNILDLEVQTLEDLHRIQQMKQSLEEQFEEMNEHELKKVQSKTRKTIKVREDRMWRKSEKYRELIKLRLSNVWYPPGSTTKRSPAWLEITLLPNGDLVSARISSSSGDDDYDESILDAANSIQKYPVPSVTDTFQRHFQKITIEFNPDRLRWM